MQTRLCKLDDLYEMQNCNLQCLPENYSMRYFLYHYLIAQELLYVSTDFNGKLAGYVLAKIDDADDEDPTKGHGQITSLATLRSHRKLGIATNVINASMEQMHKVFNTNYCALHVRRTNAAALHLYQDTLKFRCAEVDVGYYLDGEDAFHMKRYFPGKNSGKTPLYYIEKGKLMKEGMDSGGNFMSKAMFMLQQREANGGKPCRGGIQGQVDFNGVVPEEMARAGGGNKQKPSATPQGGAAEPSVAGQAAAEGQSAGAANATTGKNSQKKKGGKN